jgi:hypothetical protein
LETRRIHLPGAPFPNLHLKVDKRLCAAKMKQGLSGRADNFGVKRERKINIKNALFFI